MHRAGHPHLRVFGSERRSGSSYTRCTRDAQAHVASPHRDQGPVTRRLGLDSADSYVARRQLDRLTRPRGPHGLLAAAHRMLSCWVSHTRPPGAPRMTYGRSVIKALDTFDLDHKKGPGLAVDRLAWRAMLHSEQPPTAYRAHRPRPPPPFRNLLSTTAKRQTSFKGTEVHGHRAN